MNKLLLLLLIFLPSIVFGTTFDDEWPIYVYGDASYYKLIYDGIASIVQDTNFMDSTYYLVFLASTVLAAKNFSQSNLGGALWNASAGIGVVSMLLWPTSTVHILDVRTLHGFVYPTNQGTGDYAGYSKVDHVPFYLAAIPSFATALKYHIIDISTDALTPISGGSFRDSGFATPMTLADDMVGVASFKYSKDDQYIAPKFEQALSHYIEKCIINEAIYIDKSTIFGVMDPKGQQIDALKPSNFSSMNLANTDIQDLRGVDTTCGAFWNSEIAAKTGTVGGVLLQNLEDKNPKMNVAAMADAVAGVAGIETNASIGSVTLTNAMLNIATTATLLNTFTKAGAGLSGIDLSNSVAAKQSLTANMTDSTGQFKWMIRVIPVLEFLIFGILIFLGLLMGMVAGFSGAERGGKMILNFATGLVAFSFIDVALAIVQAISLYYYNTKMMDAMIMLGQNPFTATNIPLYMQETGYMSGMMGLAAILVVPLVVTVVFKGETAAAMGAYSSIMGKYKGDGGGQNLGNSLGNGAAVHAAEAKEYEESARRELHGGYGLSVPHGVLASEMLARVSAEAAGYGGNLGANRMASTEFGSNQGYMGARIEAGMGSGIQKISAELGAGRGLMRTINEDPSSVHNFMEQSGNEASSGFSATAKKGALSESNPLLSRENQIEAAKGNAETDLRKMVASGLGASKAFIDGIGNDFSYQTQTDAEAGINATAAKGKFSKDNVEFNRDEQVKAAMVMANDGLVKGVQNAKGMVGSMGFDENGNIDNKEQFDLYKDGLNINSRIAANKVMGAGIWAEGKTERETIDAMSDIQRVGAMGVAGEVAKGDAFQKSNYGGSLDKFEADSTDIEKSKSDSMFGQVKGVRDNYKVNGDMYSQNAEYSEESKQQSTNAKIATQGGIQAAVATDIADSAMKAASQMLNIEANKKAGFIDDSGSVTDRGMRAFAISPTEMAGQLGVKESVLFGENAGNNIVEQLKMTGSKAGKSEKDINAALQAIGLTDENGENAASGLDLVGALAKMGAMNYSSSKALSFMGMTMSANIDGQGSAKVVKADGGNAVSMAESMESGSKEILNNNVKQLNNTSAKDFNQLQNTNGNMQEAADRVKTRDKLEYEASIKTQTLDGVTAAIHKVTPAGEEESAAGVAGTVGTAAAGVLATYGAYKLDKKFNPETEMIAKMDKQGNPVLDADGKPEMVEKETGRGKFFAGLKDGTDDLFSGAKNPESSHQTSGSSTNNSNNNQPNEANDNKSDNGAHKTPPNSDTNNIPNSGETVKPNSNISSEIDAEYKKQQMLSKDESFRNDMSKLQDRQAAEKALNPDNTNVDSRHNMEKAAMEDAHAQRISEANNGVKKGGGGLKGLLAGLGLAFASGASADDIINSTSEDVSEFSKNLSAKNYSNATANALGFVFGKDAGNDVVASGIELSKGNVSGAVGGGLRAAGNFGEDLINLGGSISNNVLGTNFGKMDMVKNEGTQYMASQAQQTVETQPTESKSVASQAQQTVEAQTKHQVADIKPVDLVQSTQTAEAKTVEVSQPINMVSKPVVASEHQGAFTQPSGFNASQAIQQDQIAQSSMVSAHNLQTIASLKQGRSDFFDMKDANGEKVKFETSGKSSDYPLMMNGQNMGMPYEQFASMMQNGEMASQFSNAISSSEMSNKDAYNTTNKLLQDMSMQSRTADRKQMIHNNASDTNRSMQHKEMLEASGTNKDEEV